MDDVQGKSKLSKSILEMKFMKKSKERVEKEEDDAEGHAMYSKEITEEMRKAGSFMPQVSIRLCKNFVDGRMSFGGYNPRIEKLMEIEYASKKERIEKSRETSVSDIEMAKKLNPLIGMMEKKFRPKSQKKSFPRNGPRYTDYDRPNKNGRKKPNRFMKPCDV